MTASHRVLVADDHEDFRRGLQALLAATPSVEVVGTAAEEVEAVRVAHETIAGIDPPLVADGLGRFVGPVPVERRIGIAAHPQNAFGVVADLVAVAVAQRDLVAGDAKTGGAEPWSYLIVGGVQLATHSWMSDPRMTSEELIDYLTMLSWSALCGIVEVGGSLEKFREEPHPSPIVPPRTSHG